MPLNRKVHLISFAVPFPPNYGGVIDVYYKIEQLKALGVSVILHAFTYGSRQQTDVSSLCEKVYYYHRKKSFFNQLSSLPFIVKSRDNKELLNNLLADEHPILFEGLHSTFFISNEKLKSRLRFLRMHNIESDYYFHLYKAERNWIKKFFFLIESKKLRRYEKQILSDKDINILAISNKDYETLNFHKKTYFISAFHSFQNVVCNEGKGNFALYHGKLDIGENNEAALFLVKEVFSKINYPLIIAGSNPTEELKKAASLNSNISIKSNLTTEEIHLLLQQAQVNVLPTFQATGVKLKLLAALFSGKYCLVNNAMIRETNLEEYCYIANNPQEWVKQLNEIKDKTFSIEDVKKRKKLEESDFSNKANAVKLYALLFPSS